MKRYLDADTGAEIPAGKVSAAITVDLEINSRVLDAASARLPYVQEFERQNYGKSTTNLSTLAETILKDWQPGDTTPPRQPGRAVCPNCGNEYALYANGKMRVHGPPGNQCPEYIAQPRKATRTRPLRFPMNRQEYEEIRNRIHINGQSVAHVITQRLAQFARKGRL